MTPGKDDVYPLGLAKYRLRERTPERNVPFIVSVMGSELSNYERGLRKRRRAPGVASV